MENEIAVLGCLGIDDKPQTIEKPKLPQTGGKQPTQTVNKNPQTTESTTEQTPSYIVTQQDISSDKRMLPHTGELEQAGALMLGILFLILFLIYRQKSKPQRSIA